MPRAALLAALLFLGGFQCSELLAPAVPVKVCRRESKVGNGEVIRVRNTTDKVVALWFTSNGKRVDFTLQPHGVKEFGWLEGYTVGENTTCTVGGEGYAAVSFTKETESPDC
ncbi:MAG TPA: hypothetical protein VHW00_19730 [Thermoanaerobaculia bacterium]|nr:hypothetical protein [Thermoanaerobaculia bacterium]